SEFDRQAARNDAMPTHPPAFQRLDGFPARIGRVAGERREARDEDVGCRALAHGKASHAISTRLTASRGSAVATCMRMTAFGSSSSSSAAGTRLKLAAIGVSRVPQ